MQVGDIGVAINVTIRDRQTGNPINLTGATLIEFRLTAPNRVSKVLIGSVLDGAAGRVQYVTLAATDIDRAGVWQVEIYYELGAALRTTSTTGFRAYP